MTIRAVLFDAAGVLTAPFSADLVTDAIAAGSDPEVLFNVLYPIFASAGDGASAGNQLERGELTLEDFFASLDGNETDIRRVLDPAAPEFFGHRLTANVPMQAFVEEVASSGFRTGLVSNIVHEWIDVWERVVPTSLPFAGRVYSCVEGARKPEPAIYQAALAQVGVAPSEALFLDDFEAMAEGARAVGMHAVHVADTGAAIDEARALLGI